MNPDQRPSIKDLISHELFRNNLIYEELKINSEMNLQRY